MNQARVRVLVVDDDFMVARLHAGVVAKQPGFEVVGVANTGAQALALVDKERPDLLLLDVYLPDMTGLQVLERLRAVAGSPGAPDPDVLVLSAARDAETLRRAQHGGAFHYLIKPFEVEALQAKLVEYSGYHAQVVSIDDAQQDDVERLFRPGGGRGGHKEPPKGISTETVELVVRALRQTAGEVSAQECADATGLSRSSARRYLEHLVDTGRASVRHQYGSTGRPERRYRLS